MSPSNKQLPPAPGTCPRHHAVYQCSRTPRKQLGWPEQWSPHWPRCPSKLVMVKWCLMSSDVSWHIRDKLWPVPKHGSVILYVHEGSLGRTAQDGHLDSHTAPELWHQSCCCWSLLYSAILRSRADSLRSHVILHEWIAFYSACFEYPPKWCTYSAGMAGARWNWDNPVIF